ncbi:NUDIX domain-containing protein [Kitasatospora sp. NPDC059599]|uniref:NUDIX domain-containing protein n=1 Tax=Kitasatospora sp. NPDC059599 TaxID=3346880 RepID=UPI0036D0654D
MVELHRRSPQWRVRPDLNRSLNPGRWGWEVPAGRAGPGEDPAAAVVREVGEETGWRPGRVEPSRVVDRVRLHGRHQ